MLIRFGLCAALLAGAAAQVNAQEESLAAGKDFVYVCQDAGAGAYEAFPDVCRLQDGRLMAVFYAGWTHVSMPDAERPRGGRVSACYSSDEGATWSPAVTVFDGPDDDRDPSVVQLKDGRILVNFFTLRTKTGGGWRGLGSWMVESADNGATWTGLRNVSPYYCSSPVRVLSNGDLILGLYDEMEGDAWGAVALSTDQGRTWSQPIDIPNGGVRYDAETDVIELRDGRLYALQRTAKESMGLSISTDGGKAWSVTEPVGFPGHCPYFHRASIKGADTNDVRDMILVAHRLPSTSLHYSLDECATWSENVLVDSVGGAYPSMVDLKDGSVLIIYYEEGENSSIRARKFNATPSGIDWLGWDE
ncbi:MAG: glycoside hydrolase [Candidatus Hydrogenedentes bacterium]|nr:glycoside hydrolase [Candidatus Hydrogenedentota bacterium]